MVLRVLIRGAKPEDALGVAVVHVRAWQVGYRGLMPDGYLDGLRPEDRAAKYTFGDTRPERPATIVAVDDSEKICGFAATGPARDADAARAGELMALNVDPDVWGHGIGRLLIAEARERLRARGHADAILWTMEGNDRAERFYRADGWTPDGTRRTEEIWGISASERRFRRALP